MEPENQASIQDAARQLAFIESEISGLTEQADQLRAYLSTRLGNGKHAAGQYQVTITQARRLDPKKVTAAFPVAQFPGIYEPKLSTPALRRAVSQEELERLDLYATSRPTVKVSAAK